MFSFFIDRQWRIRSCHSWHVTHECGMSCHNVTHECGMSCHNVTHECLWSVFRWGQRMTSMVRVSIAGTAECHKIPLWPRAFKRLKFWHGIGVCTSFPFRVHSSEYFKRTRSHKRCILPLETLYSVIVEYTANAVNAHSFTRIVSCHSKLCTLSLWNTLQTL